MEADPKYPGILLPVVYTWWGSSQSLYVGKGVHFSDMVSKSASFCFTHPANTTAIMLLCEIALGNTY